MYLCENKGKKKFSSWLLLTNSEVTVKVHLTKRSFTMSVIAKLKLVASKRERFLSPTVARRQKLADKLEEQLALCTAQ